MEVQLLTELNPGQPLALLLTPENLESLKALLPAPVAQALAATPDVAEKDNTFSYRTPEHRVEARGLGPVAKVEAETFRKTLHGLLLQAHSLKYDNLQLAFTLPQLFGGSEYLFQALGEIPHLSSYQFLHYKKEPKPFTVKTVGIYTGGEAESLVVQAAKVAECVCLTRDLVNEPPNVLTAVELSRRAQAAGAQYGFSVEVWDKAKITEAGMGGLLAVNRGSQDPPTFTILRHAPAGTQDQPPLVLVGKGVVFDTGGLSLKPTPSSMDYMKCDMAGAGVVIGLVSALARNNIQRHVIGLIPATDNRPGENAYTPNDVVTMMDGTTVEVLNTDAEGRMILADALHYAKQLKPALVINLATLTGSAAAALGNQAAAAFSTADDTTTHLLLNTGQHVYERMVLFPLWDDYKDLLKSDIADMKNIGGAKAGAITAAKFLHHFTDYPFIHLDIAAPAWSDKVDDYRGKNGTGWGVRLLFDFIIHL